MEPPPRRPVRVMRAMSSGVRRIKGNLAGRELAVKIAVGLGVRRGSNAVAPGAPQPSAVVDWKPAAEDSKLEDNAPKQVLRPPRRQRLRLRSTGSVAALELRVRRARAWATGVQSAD